MKAVFKNLTVFGLIAGFFFSGVIALWAASLEVPDLETLDNRKVAQSTKIYDRTGEILLYDLHGDIQRTTVGYDKISQNIKNATVAIEDAAFFQHAGIEPTAIFRAAVVNLLALGYEQGGSTITQQVVKNSLLTQEKTIARKLKELILALKLESSTDKEHILELYLNETPYGGSVYGIEEASQTYFGKHASDISVAEAAYLAALPQAPTYYLNNPNELEKRKNRVIEQMRLSGAISQNDAEEAHETTKNLSPQTSTSIKAPHFVFYVIEKLEDKYGKEFLETRGLEITTTVDLGLQKEAERIIEHYGEINEEKFNAKNAGIIATDPETGEILTMVGSRDYHNNEREGNFNVTIHPNRQPGSAFKPFVYAAALMRGYTPETVVFDTKTQFHSGCDWEGNPVQSGVSEDDCYQPVNYDGVYRGPVTFREALAQSINIPAIKVLYLAGLQSALETAQAMGISSLGGATQYGLTLVLGGGEVSLLEMTQAYGVFANDGMRANEVAILEVRDGDGEIIDKATIESRRAIPEQTARQISDMLSDNDARAPAFGFNSPLHFPGYDVAAKTGTTNDYKDMWIIGYTPTVAVGAWSGNNDFTSMSKEVAGFVVAPMWNAFMDEAIEERPKRDFTEPRPIQNYAELKPILRGKWRGGESYTIDTISGNLATEHTPEETTKEIVVTDVHSILYWLDPDNPRGEQPSNPTNSSQFTLWEKPVLNWAQEEGIASSTEQKPSEYDTIHVPENKPRVSVSGIISGDEVSLNSQTSTTVDVTAKYGLKKANVFINETLVNTYTGTPFTVSFTPASISSITNENVLRIVAYDAVMNRQTVEIPFKVVD